MENALLIGLSNQMALRRELDIIANNMANVTTNGFKSRSSKFEQFVSPKANADTFQRPDQRLLYVIDSQSPLDLSQGPIERTGNPLDVAIKGDKAFFVVQSPNGERYTRNGSFDINPQGQLVTSDGHVVQGENGPIAFGNQESGIYIAKDGTVSSNQGQRGRIRLVTFPNPLNLKNEGANLFSSPVPAQPAGPLAAVEQASLERSNVRPVLEMSRLIEVNRAYASVAGMVGRLDELRRTAISRLADVQNG